MVTDNDTDSEKKSKSQVKRELKALQELGRQLVELAPANLERVTLPEDARQAVIEARQLKREARRRQLQRIGKLLRGVDEASLREALQRIDQPHREEVRRLHQLEQWRDRLVDGDDKVLDEILVRHPDAERQHLRQLARNAALEQQRGQSPKSARLLFRYLAELDSDDAG